MKLFKSILVLVVFAAFVFSGCNSTTNPIDNTVKEKPDKPSNLQASSLSTSSIKLKWTLSPSETNALFQDYILDITPGTFQSIPISKGVNNYTVTGLTEGTVYTFTLHARYTTNNTESDSAATVTWSPATRFTLNNNDDVIKLYEYASSFGSGLDFYDATSMKPKTLTVSGAANWNLALDTRTSGQVVIGSPNAITYNYTGTPPVTEMSTDYWDAASLDDVFDSQALSVPTFSETKVDLNSLTLNLGGVFVFRVKEANNTSYTYVKVLVKKTGGAFLQGTSPNRYIECIVSYQMVPGVPYAM